MEGCTHDAMFAPLPQTQLKDSKGIFFDIFIFK